MEEARESLLLVDRQIGKTAVAVDTIINQKDTDMLNVSKLLLDRSHQL
jgi:F0F1-type ATP synthase alpha subunit